jgi:ribosomal protein S27AE
MESNDYTTSTQGEGRCPRCGDGTLKAWYELSEEEREVARRLPASADFPLDERAARHRFCTRCWYEERADTPRVA